MYILSSSLFYVIYINNLNEYILTLIYNTFYTYIFIKIHINILLV